jgi:hypothetical protein
MITLVSTSTNGSSIPLAFPKASKTSFTLLFWCGRENWPSTLTTKESPEYVSLWKVAKLEVLPILTQLLTDDAVSEDDAAPVVNADSKIQEVLEFDKETWLVSRDVLHNPSGCGR